LKKVLLIGGVLAFRGVSPVALMASGLLSKEFIESSIDELDILSEPGKDE
jgi:hypothetical protein